MNKVPLCRALASWIDAGRCAGPAGDVGWMIVLFWSAGGVRRRGIDEDVGF